MKKTLLVLCCVLLLSGCAVTKKQGLNLSRDHFKNTATVKDDDLDTTARITTAKGFCELHGLLGIRWNDNFLRAFIDKQTGKRAFQVYQVIPCKTYQDFDYYESVNYETPYGVKSQDLTVILRDDGDCRGDRTKSCLFTEHVGFLVDERILRAIAASYAPGQEKVWRFRFYSSSGREHNDYMLQAEVAGMLDKVDEYVSRRGLPGR